MAVSDEIRAKLSAGFAATELEVIDESEKHRGHSGWREGGETHFRVLLRSPDLAAMGRIDRHRAVHAALGPELVARIHALALDLG